MEKEIAIIGAGVAGLACARALGAAGRRVRVFDKGRSPGGRIATRRVETAAGAAQFDHGAQFFTARDPGFIAALAQLDGVGLHPWAPVAARGGQVAAPGMSALPKAFARGLDVICSTQVGALVGEPHAWSLRGEDGQNLGDFAAVVVATPAEQAAPLLAGVAPHLAREAAAAVTAPCWTGLFAFAEPIASGETVLEPHHDPVLAWLACDSAKPGRPAGPQCWVAQAHADFTRAHLERPPEDVAPMLLEALHRMLGASPAPILMQAHRWRFAKVEKPAARAFAWDRDLGVGMCGDWRLGPRVECAWMSGHALGGAIVA